MPQISAKVSMVLGQSLCWRMKGHSFSPSQLYSRVCTINSGQQKSSLVSSGKCLIAVEDKADDSSRSSKIILPVKIKISTSFTF